MSDYLILGGGVIGLLVARELAEAGAHVSIIERGECCKEASWAGGGIVSPLYPWRYSPPVTALALRAQSAYPALAAALFEETGIDPELERTGLLMLDAEDGTEALAWSARSGRTVTRVSTSFLQTHEPNLATEFGTGLWMPEIANVRNPRLCKALVQSLRNNPRVAIREHCEVVALEPDASRQRVAHVHIDRAGIRERMTGQQIIITAGAWSGEMLGSLGVQLPVVPVKGQMLLFRTERRLLNSIVLTKGRYLIPRRDCHLLAGSTLEHTAFDRSTTEEALHSLLGSATSLVPALKLCRVEQQWAGLRPGAPHGIPYIGRVPGFENLYINAGHFRNGLVLAPASAELLADLLLGRRPCVDPTAYSPALVR